MIRNETESSGITSVEERNEPHRAVKRATTESLPTQCILIGVTLLFLTLFLLVPLVCVFYEAFSDGALGFFKAVSSKETMSAARMTLAATLIAVILNLAFGLVAAWCIGKFRFRGKGVLLSVIDVPFAISPIIAGLLFVFMFNPTSPLGKLLASWNIRVLYSMPAVVLVTVFVTFPFVVRELIPVMEAQGDEEEQAARVLGASGWQIFWRVTLPNIKWALAYGVILCNARAMGEFGAAVVVARNSVKTNTLPLHINALYQSYENGSAPFAVATLLATMAIVTLIVKVIMEFIMRSSSETD